MLLALVWCIVTMRLFVALFCAYIFSASTHRLISFNNRVCVMIKCESLFHDRRVRHIIIFCFACLFGYVFGAWYITRYSISSKVLLLEFPQMSIVTGVMISALPFIVFYICFRYRADHLIFPLAFIRMFLFMYCFGAITIAYADAGWLVRLLILFSDCITVPLLIWYTITKLIHTHRKRDRHFKTCLVVIIVVRCIDCYVISPFAWKLLKF